MTGLTWSATLELARSLGKAKRRKMFVYAIRTHAGHWVYVVSIYPKNTPDWVKLGYLR